MIDDNGYVGIYQQTIDAQLEKLRAAKCVRVKAGKASGEKETWKKLLYVLDRRARPRRITGAEVARVHTNT